MTGLEGTRLGAYELIERIGGGGMAEVYRARQLSAFGRDVALKVLHPGFTQDQAFRARFLREAQAVSRLSHPNILPLIEFGEEKGMLYLVMPLVREGTLRDLLQQRNGPLPVEEAVPLFTQLCDAVQYAHDEGIIHRDIKPQNVLLQRGAYVLLADFGIARDRFDTQVTATGAGIGTVEYMAPEQALGKADACSDIYSLGVVLYQLLTGVVPYTGTAPLQVLLKHADEPLPDPRQHNPNLAPELVQTLQTALAKDPTRRFESAAAFSRAVQGQPAPDTQATRRLQDSAIIPAAAPLLAPGGPPPAGASGWGAQTPNGGDWFDAPTWTGQGNAGRGTGESAGGEDHRQRGHRSLIVALIAALVLLIVASSLAYGYFGLGWLGFGAGSSGAQQVTPSPSSQPTHSPTLSPTNQPTTPTPTSPPPTPTPTSRSPEPTPTSPPIRPSPTPTHPPRTPTPPPGPSPTPTSPPEPSPTPTPAPPSPTPPTPTSAPPTGPTPTPTS